jgi:hypothetical protein
MNALSSYKVEHDNSIQKLILSVYIEIFQSWNNECIKYKVEHSRK